MTHESDARRDSYRWLEGMQARSAVPSARPRHVECCGASSTFPLRRTFGERTEEAEEAGGQSLKCPTCGKWGPPKRGATTLVPRQRVPETDPAPL